MLTARPLPGSAVLASLLVGVLVLGLFPAGADAQRRRRRHDDETAAAAVPTEGVVTFAGDYEGAEVLVDEVFVGTMPVDPLPLPVGTHTVRARLPGYTEFTDVVNVEGGGEAEVWIDMIALSEVVVVASTPSGAHVFVDGTFLGDTPTDVELIEGDHTIRISLAGYEEIERSLTAVAGNNETIAVDLVALPEDDGEQWYESPITWGAVGGAAAAIVLVSVIVAVATSSSGPGQLDSFCSGGMAPCIRIETTF